MNQDDFKTEIEFIEKEIGKSFTFPTVSKVTLWKTVKSIDVESARQGTLQMFRRTNWYTIENIERYWNAEAQDNESKRESRKSENRKKEVVIQNDDLARKSITEVNKILRGFGSPDTPVKTDKEKEAHRTKVLNQAEELK